jgi:STE24 endopeptidase
VAVTTGVLNEFLAGRLNRGQLEAVLVHELGHHATRATRWLPLAVWLAAPWRFAARVMIGIGLAAVGRRYPRPLLAFGAAAVTVTAVVQSIQRGQAGTALLLAAMLGCAAGCPMADAWVSRRSEFAADRFAAECGAGRQLVAALWALDRRTACSVRCVVGHGAAVLCPALQSAVQVRDVGVAGGLQALEGQR